VYERLRRVGFTRHYVRKVAALPSWWDDALWDDPASRAVGLMHLSRHLGIDISTLQNPMAELRLKDFGVCKYKKQAGTTDDELLLSRVIATRAAQLAAAAMDRPHRPVPSAGVLRVAILEQAPWVGFELLLDYCWSVGIPILHANNFPADGKKPMGFTLRVNGRPAIVLCSEKVQPAWPLFILAHELGHLHHGHVPENGAIFDENVHKNEPDEEERQADRYAIELLTGRADAAFSTDGRWPKADRLATLARGFGARNQIDPGHVVLNWAHSTGEVWPIANAALKILNPAADAVRTVGERLAANLDWERLPEDSSEFLMRITRQETPE
jgi:hypothetical protein